MKNYIVFTFLFVICAVSAQDNVAVSANASNVFASASSSNVAAQSGSTTFYNPKRDVDGTEYLFDTWDNSAIVHTIDKRRFLLRNVNLNINRNSFIAKISNDSIFTLSLNTIEKVIINNKTFKNVYSDGGKKIYEIVYDAKDFTILKGYHIQIVSGSPNPMVNRSNDKFVRKKSYFVNIGNTVKPMRLSKKKVLRLFENTPEKADKLEKFMNDNNLSYKKVRSLKRGLDYVSLN